MSEMPYAAAITIRAAVQKILTVSPAPFWKVLSITPALNPAPPTFPQTMLRSLSPRRRKRGNYGVQLRSLQMLDLSLLWLTPRVSVYRRGGSSRRRSVGISFFQLA